MQSNGQKSIIYQSRKDFPFNEMRLLNCNVLNPCWKDPPSKKNAATKEFGITLILTLDREDLKNNAISTHEYNHEDDCRYYGPILGQFLGVTD